MRIVSWNLNGIRAAIRKGFDEFVERIDGDVWMLQEVRALPEQLPKTWEIPNDMEIIWHPAKRKGYSGVATMSRYEIDLDGRGISTEIDPNDSEGRVLRTRINGCLFINTYLPSGSSGRQIMKEKWMEDFSQFVRQYLNSEEPVYIAGDLNIAHTEDDIHNPSGNKNTSGFLPQERNWFSKLLAEGWHDLFREHRGSGKGPYSWWSNRGRARELDRGWRIDYILSNESGAKKFQSAMIMREGGLVISDHAPVIVDLKI